MKLFCTPIVTKKVEYIDTRVIKSIGRYDIEGELAAEEYPADFVKLHINIGGRRKQN